MAGQVKKLPYEGSYWWSDSKKVTTLLEKELCEILRSVRVSTITIRGTDFDDGRQGRKVQITVSDNEITVVKSYP